MFCFFSSVGTSKLSQDCGLKCFVDVWFVPMTFPVCRAATNNFSFCDHSSCNTYRAESPTLSGVVDYGWPSLHSPILSGVTDYGWPSLHSPILSGVTDYGRPSLHSPILSGVTDYGRPSLHFPPLSGVTHYRWANLTPQECQESWTMDDLASTSPPQSAVVHYGRPSLTSSTLLAVMDYGWPSLHYTRVHLQVYSLASQWVTAQSSEYSFFFKQSATYCHQTHQVCKNKIKNKKRRKKMKKIQRTIINYQLLWFQQTYESSWIPDKKYFTFSRFVIGVAIKTNQSPPWYSGTYLGGNSINNHTAIVRVV